MSWRTRVACACSTLLVLLSALLLLRVSRKPEDGRSFHVQTRAPASQKSTGSVMRRARKRGLAGPTPISSNDRNADQFGGLRRDQFRSSAKVIQESLASTASTPSFTWVNPGPVNLTLGPLGFATTGVSGKLQAFAWEPSHPQVMYAGGGIGSGNVGPAT